LCLERKKMFCKFCGKNLPEGAKFCTGCGANLEGGAPASAAPANSASASAAAVVSSITSSPIVTNFLNTLKGFFSPKMVETVGKSAQSKGLEWCLTALISILTYAFAFALNMKAIFGEDGPEEYEFGSMLLFGFLFSVLTFFLFSFALFGALRLVSKKNVGLFNVFNLVATASLLLACVWILNIVLAFLWAPFILITSLAAFFITVLLIYIGMQKIDRFEASPFFAYAIALVAFVFVAILGGEVMINAIAETDESFIKSVMQLISASFYMGTAM